MVRFHPSFNLISQPCNPNQYIGFVLNKYLLSLAAMVQRATEWATTEWAVMDTPGPSAERV